MKLYSSSRVEQTNKNKFAQTKIRFFPLKTSHQKLRFFYYIRPCAGGYAVYLPIQVHAVIPRTYYTVQKTHYKVVGFYIVRICQKLQTAFYVGFSIFFSLNKTKPSLSTTFYSTLAIFYIASSFNCNRHILGKFNDLLPVLPGHRSSKLYSPASHWPFQWPRSKINR